MRIVFASGNQHKIQEVRQILADWPVQIQGYDGQMPRETGSTFVENAIIKAQAAAGDLPVIADDSGICVEAMGGMPGILSARWALDQRNLDLLLWQMQDIPESRRRAEFVCAIACVMPDGQVSTVTSRWPGRLLTEPRGTNGFGYDPIFMPDGWELSAAELTAEVKNRISHRAQALRAIAETIF